jgi:DNA-binding NtrC family response regulator
VQRAVILSKGESIEEQDLPEDLQVAGIYNDANPQAPATFQARKQRAIEKFERDELSRILTQTGGKVRESARIAGMDVKNFSEKLLRHCIKAEDYKK